MANMTLLDALNASLTRTKTYVDTELAKKANSSHGTHVTWSTTTPKANGTAAVGSETKVARGDHVHPLQTTVSGNAGSATKLATARNIVIGNKTNSFNGTANITYSLADIGATETVAWDCSIKCATWSRLFQFTSSNTTTGGTFLINVRATRSSVVYNPTLLVNFSHSTKCKIVQLNNTDYSNIKVRGVVDGNGAGYFEIYDNVNGATNSTTQTVSITVTKISSGLNITKYTAFTDGTTIPSNYSSQGEMTTVSGTVYTGKASTAGTADSATQFSANKSVTLTGDVTGTASSKAGWSVATTLASSGVTAGSYGPSANASPAHSGTFNVPYITVDAKGRVTSAATRTITLPADNNTWRGIQNNLTSDSTTDSLAAAQGKALKALIDGKANSSHNHTSLTGITSLAFAANSDDSSVIKITKDSATSYTDFVMSDDAGSDMWRWRFSAWDSSTSSQTAEYNLMTLKATSTTKGQLSVNGNITADSFTEGGTALSSKYAVASHTHNYAGSSSAGGAANSVKTNLIIKLNGGSTEGTNLFTFNGSTAKTVNITPSAIGASASSHTHSYLPVQVLTTGDLDTIKTTGYYSLKNTLTNSPVGGHAMLFVDFSVGTPVQIFKHDTTFKLYQRTWNSSSSTWSAWTSVMANDISGNAASATTASTATKLATARTINGTSFDGSANITTANWGTARTLTIGKKGNSVNGSANVSWSLSDIMGRATTASTSSTNKNKYTKFARVDVSSGAYTHCTGTFDFVPQESQTVQGSLSYYIRTNSAITSTSLSLIWMRINNVEYANSVVAVKVSDGVYDLYYKPLYDWDTMSITNINCTNPGKITMYSNQSYVDSVTAAATSSLISHTATSAKLTTARTLTIGNKGKTFDGSGNVTWSHAEMGVARGNTATATTAATAQWYRIAESPNNTDNNMATFNIQGNVSSYHTSTLLAAGVSYGKNPTLVQLAHTNYGAGITKARIVYNETYSGNKAYLEVYLSQAKATKITVDMQGQHGWTLVTPSTVGSIPSGYTNKEISLAVGKIVGTFKGSGEFSSLAMSGSITLNPNNVIRSKTPADYTNTDGAAVAAGTIMNLLTYNNSGNLHIGSGPYDASLTTGATYVSSPTNLICRAKNGGYHQFQIDGTGIVNIKPDVVEAAKNIYAKGGIKSGANIVSDTAITDNLGTAAIPWNAVYADHFRIYGEANKEYGLVGAVTTGTTSTVGVARMLLGNGTASGTASNAKGTIRLYGTSSGYTDVTPGNNSANNYTLTLPSKTGTIACTSDLDSYAPKSHASSATTYGASSASNYGHAKASGTTPKANGTAAVGSETSSFARGDHVHPLQTTVNGLSFWKGTKAQYDALSSKSATTVYFITE